MKSMFTAIAILSCVVLGATAAGAITLTATTDAPMSVAVGDTFTVFVELDTSDLSTEVTNGVAFSLGIDGTALAVVTDGGTQLLVLFPVVIPSIGTFAGVPLVSPLPPNNNLDADVVRMGIWGSATPLSEPSGLAWGIETDAATVTLEVLPGATGILNIDPIFALGEGIDLDGVLVTSGVFNGFTVTVPEPSAALLSFAALTTLLGVARRRRVSAYWMALRRRDSR